MKWITFFLFVVLTTPVFSDEIDTYLFEMERQRQLIIEYEQKTIEKTKRQLRNTNNELTRRNSLNALRSSENRLKKWKDKNQLLTVRMLQPLRNGRVGWPYSIKLLQVLSPTKILCRVRLYTSISGYSRTHHLLVIENIDASGIADGDDYTPPLLYVDGTYQYFNAFGIQKTVHKAHPINEDELIKRFVAGRLHEVNRTWTDNTGQHTVQARFVAKEGSNVVLDKKHGGIVRVPIARLSEQDKGLIKLIVDQ